jgi:hypothetical protein
VDRNRHRRSQPGIVDAGRDIACKPSRSGVGWLREKTGKASREISPQSRFVIA